MVYMTHYLNTVDDHYEYLMKERLQIMPKSQIKKLKNIYWAVLKENKRRLDLDLNFVYKETSALVKQMGERRLPNIANLSLKRVERSENEFKQFLNNSCSYQVDNLVIKECKLSSLSGDTFEYLTRLFKYNLQETLEFDGVVASSTELSKLLSVCKKIKKLTFGAILGPDDQNFKVQSKYKYLKTLEFTSLDNVETCGYLRKFLTHLIKNGALKWLHELKFEGRNTANILNDVHYQLFKTNFYQRRREGDFVIFEKQKLDKYDT